VAQAPEGTGQLCSETEEHVHVFYRNRKARALAFRSMGSSYFTMRKHILQ
jgi:hypothetical protein